VKLTSTRPYLLRAIYDWLLDNQLTPHLLVNASMPGVVVPSHYVKEGKIVLNIAPAAVRDFKMDLSQVEFNARFGGAPYNVYVPVRAIEAIYSRENGKGMIFPPEEENDGPDDSHQPSGTATPRRPNLKLVK
jgi:stringent starvation protein B